MDYVLGIDIGTTSTIGILIGSDDRVVGPVTRPVSLSSPQAGWAEEDPLEWWANVKTALQDFASRGIALSDIKAVGVAGMLPAVILLDEDGRLLRPSIQQSDARCGAEVDDLRREVDQAAFVSRAGNGINQQLVSAKLRWIEKNEPSVFARIATVLGSYDFINWRLTGERAVEQNWALEAGFVDIATDEIADDLVALAHITRGSLPRKVASHEILGAVTAQAAEETGLAAGTPVVGGAADLIASALAAGVTRKGDVLLKFGGSVDILIATPHARPDPRMYLDYHLVPGLYMPNGCMATGGSGLNWFAKTFAGCERIEAEKAAFPSINGLTSWQKPLPRVREGSRSFPIFSARRRRFTTPRRAGSSPGSTSRMESATCGAPCSKATATRSRITSRCSRTWATPWSATALRTAARRAASGCRSSRTSCRSRSSCSTAIQGPAWAPPGPPPWELAGHRIGTVSHASSASTR
jgi:xylulokinase